MADQLEVCNLALSNIGSAAAIEDIDEDSKEAYTCRLHWDNCVKAALREHDWNYARRRTALALFGTPPTTEWAYQYAIPSDMMAARRIVNGSLGSSTAASSGIGSLIYDPTANIPDSPDIPFEIALSLDGTARVLLTDQADAILCYTANLINPALYDAQFVEALSWKLGSMIAMAIRGDIKTKQAAETMYQNLKISSFASSGAEGTPRQTPDAPWIQARF